MKKGKPISSTEAIKIMAEHCQRLGIKFTEIKHPEGTASVRFMNKPKKNQ